MRITEHVHALKLPFKIKLNADHELDRFVYLYLIYGQQVYLIDTGISGSEQIIFEYLKKTGRNPAEISKIFLTHSHPDHIGAARNIKEQTGCTVAAHKAEVDWIEDVDKQYRERTVPGFHSLVGGPVKVEHTLQAGDIINLEDQLELQIYHTPGHSRGSISLMLLPDRALFSGDVIPLPGDVPIYDDIQASIESIKMLKKLEGISMLLSAWDEPRADSQAYQVMDAGLAYLNNIHQVVIDNARSYSPAIEPRWCRTILEELGIPPAAANPLVGRSLLSHLNWLDADSKRTNQH
jgi:glyoxylase-like metal-dependent hydrolase (beta-lactamase superfamily II)